MKKLIFIVSVLLIGLIVYSCGNPLRSQANGGEVMGISMMSWEEPTPYGMVLIKRGSLKIGTDQKDSLWGINEPSKEISIEAFWMDENEVTNSKYKQFVFWVRDSIIRERLADPAYGGDETFRIEEDEEGNPIEPHLNWRRPIPWRKPTEDQLVAINSVYYTHPITGTRMLDDKQLNYRYEIFDYLNAALRKNRLNPEERNRNTDITVDPDEVVMISKDTAYIDEEGRIVRSTVNRALTSLFDFLNTYIVNVYPDTTCWVNDFQNSYNEPYMRLYFSHPSYNEYPVVGVSWEQANAFCNWRTDYLLAGLGPQARFIQRYRLPTEAEWEFAARGKEENLYPWRQSEDMKSDKGCYYANYKVNKGDYTQDGHLITTRVGSFSANSNGLYDMAGNVAEWTSTAYTAQGISGMSDMNPEFSYNAAKEDPYRMKRKVVRGGSWKDGARFIRSDMRGYEYQNEQRSFIGFRCVRTQVGGGRQGR